MKSLHTPSPLGYSIAMSANTTKLTSIVEVIFSDTMFDIYLNDRAYWRNVPANVWGYKLGGYQVLKKWLSYRRARFDGVGAEVGGGPALRGGGEKGFDAIGVGG